MIAVIQVDLKTQYPDIAADFVISDEDLLAAFVGEQCLGVIAPDQNVFFIYINQPDQSSLTTSGIGLRSTATSSKHPKSFPSPTMSV